MSEEKKEESNLSKCSKCQEIKLRKQEGFYPDGRNKKYIDEDGNLYVGRKCPSCVKSHMLGRMRKLRADRKPTKE